MRKRIGWGERVIGGSILAASLAACSPPHDYVANDDPEFPRIRYAVTTVSVNDRCPVTKSKLNRRLDPLRVNGRAIGFC